MSSSKYLKLLAIVESDYKPITGEITCKDDNWVCENVLTIKLKEDFSVESPTLVSDLGHFLESVLIIAEERYNE